MLCSVSVGCRGMWDNITCWPSAQVGEMVLRQCPTYFSFFSDMHGNVTRSCTKQGWAGMHPVSYAVACGYDVNTSAMEETQFFGTVKIGYTVGHSLSLMSLTVAMTILCVFRKLHCTRNYIHMHLFMSFILRAIAVFVKDVVLFESGESDHCFVGSIGCKAAIVFFQYCIMANFFWLLVEGLYLHTLLVVSFFSERKYFWWYIMIGWGGPSVFITAWSITRAYYNDIGCWDIIEAPYWWIIKAPILVSILANSILLICIIRILVQKLHSPDVGRSESNQYLTFHLHLTSSHSLYCEALIWKCLSTWIPIFCSSKEYNTITVYVKLAKSTLLLIPLFGAHYIIFAFVPDHFRVDVKLIFELVLGSFQGFVVAVLYCFLNGEVQAEIKRKWRRWHLERLLGTDTKYHHPSMGSNGTNFTTQISMLTKCSPKARRASSLQDSSLV
ncbi:VIPR protein, partial [Polyodon spathula]|nr:VIPR protein [Polyodon spathula]